MPAPFDQFPALTPVDETRGAFEAAPSFYALSAAPDADPFDLQTTRTVNTTNTQLAIYPSRRLGMPVRIDYTSGATSASLIRRVDCGQAFGLNERWTENSGLGSAFMHNPTMGGAVLRPVSASPQMRLATSPLVWFQVRQAGPIVEVEGCTIPLEFEPAGEENGAQGDHGGGLDTDVLWWRCRQFQRVTFNYEGRENVHQVHAWAYCPIQWSAHYGPFAGLMQSTIYLQDWFTSNLHQYDVVTRNSAAHGVNWSGQDTQTMSANRLAGTIDLVGGVNTSSAWPFQSDVAAFVMEGADAIANPLYAGAIAKLYRTGDGGRQSTILQAQQRRNAAHPAAGLDVNSGQVFSLTNDSLDYRRPGWIGLEWYFVTGTTLAGVTATMDRLHRDGVLNRAQQFTVPDEVLRGLQGNPVGVQRRRS